MPNNVFATEPLGATLNDNTYEDGIYTFELYSDNTAKLTDIDIDSISHSTFVDIPGVFEKDGVDYSITTIGANAFNNIGNKDLYVAPYESPVIENGISFSNVNNIYLSSQADAESFINAGWPQEKLKIYKITKQPQDKVVTAGNITDTDTLEIIVDNPRGTGNSYSWYYCDKDGNITDNFPIADTDDMEAIEENGVYGVRIKIPTDLSYDNDNNSSKNYYFICVVGEHTDIPEKSRVVKVTVNPGDYKVSFHLNTDSNVNPVVLTVNDDRKIPSSDLSKIPNLAQLEQYREGSTFVGWTTNGEDAISENMLATTVFDKNTEFYPLWKTKITFDANGGKFEDGSTVFSTYITNYGEQYDDLLIPTREGYEIADITDKKEGGKSVKEYEEYITEDITFYIQWKLVNGNKNNIDDNEEDNLINNTGIKNPRTGDNIMIYTIICVISCLGMTTMFIILKKNKKH